MLLLERRGDPAREPRRAAAIDEIEQCVKVEAGVADDSLRKLWVESRADEPFPPPGDKRARLSLLDCWLTPSAAHVGFATHEGIFLPMAASQIARVAQKVRIRVSATLIDRGHSRG
jgi:hypothetical protein